MLVEVGLGNEGALGNSTSGFRSSHEGSILDLGLGPLSMGQSLGLRFLGWSSPILCFGFRFCHVGFLVILVGLEKIT
jgi:hypothetical protein